MISSGGHGWAEISGKMFDEKGQQGKACCPFYGRKDPGGT